MHNIHIHLHYRLCDPDWIIKWKATAMSLIQNDTAHDLTVDFTAASKMFCTSFSTSDCLSKKKKSVVTCYTNFMGYFHPYTNFMGYFHPLLQILKSKFHTELKSKRWIWAWGPIAWIYANKDWFSGIVLYLQYCKCMLIILHKHQRACSKTDQGISK